MDKDTVLSHSVVSSSLRPHEVGAKQRQLPSHCCGRSKLRNVARQTSWENKFFRGKLRERGEKPACRQTEHLTHTCRQVQCGPRLCIRGTGLFTRVLVLFLKSGTVPSTTTGRLFLQVTRIACDTLKLCPRLCPQPLDKNPIQTSYVNEGGWGRWMAAQGGSVTPVEARANSAINIIPHPGSGDRVPFGSNTPGVTSERGWPLWARSSYSSKRPMA